MAANGPIITISKAITMNVSGRDNAIRTSASIQENSPENYYKALILSMSATKRGAAAIVSAVATTLGVKRRNGGLGGGV
jgi:hypothetical protein